MAAERFSNARRKVSEFFGLFFLLVVIVGLPLLFLLQWAVSATFGDDAWNSYTQAIGWLTAVILIPLFIALMDFVPRKPKQAKKKRRKRKKPAKKAAAKRPAKKVKKRPARAAR